MDPFTQPWFYSVQKYRIATSIRESKNASNVFVCAISNSYASKASSNPLDFCAIHDAVNASPSTRGVIYHTKM